MKELPWVEAPNAQYIAEMPYGRAIIEPCDLAVVGGNFEARLELPSGVVIAKQVCDLESFKIWTWVSLPLLDQAKGNFYECGHIWATLNMCQQLMSLETDAIHWLRIEHIKAWIAQNTEQHYKVVDIPFPTHQPIEFNWIQDGNRFYVDTPYGQAIITETHDKGIIGGGIQHKAQIVHRTGVVLDCYAWVDFADAEHAIRRKLDELLKPYIYEALLDGIHFTLDICDRLLPEDADPIHSSRLATLGTRIHLALD